MSLIAQYATSWPLSWMMHATVACIFALLVGHWVVLRPRLRDALWKAALVLPVGTSLWSVVAPPIVPGSLSVATFARAHMPQVLRTARASVQLTDAAPGATVRLEEVGIEWLRYLALAGMLIPALVATSRMIERRRRYREEIRTRRPATAGDLCIDTAALSTSRRSVRISVSAVVGSAAALGRDEICVSTAFAALDGAEQLGVLAHEIAHLERRDLAWIAFADAVACALAAQPLVRMVAHRLRRDAEFICDDVAVSRTSDAAAYVRALMAFASKHDTTLAAALAYGSSPIVQRAERVLGAVSRDRWLYTPAVAVLLLLLFGGLVSLPTLNLDPAAHTRVSVRHISGSAAQTRINVEIDEP